MSTPLTTAIQNLTASANATTGASDTTLAAAVARLIAGYQGGGGSVPCTGVSLSDATLTFTAIGATATLTATLTPANTTDTLTWTSSDTTIATVADGVVTCAGVGSATITATCGSYSATCTVTSTVTILLTDKDALSHYVLTATDISNGKDYVSRYSAVRGRLYYDVSNPLSGYPLICNTDATFDTVYPIEIPQGATSVSVLKSANWLYIYLVLVDANSVYTYSLSDMRDSCKAIYAAYDVHNSDWSASEGTFTYEIPSGANGISVAFFTKSGISDSDSVTGDTSALTFT